MMMSNQGNYGGNNNDWNPNFSGYGNTYGGFAVTNLNRVW